MDTFSTDAPQASGSGYSPVRWQAIVDLTEQMLATAGEGEWEQLAELEVKRHQMLQVFFASSGKTLQAKSPDKLRGAIDKLLSMDAQILTASENARADISRELIKISQQRNAAKAYSAHTG